VPQTFKLINREREIRENLGFREVLSCLIFPPLHLYVVVGAVVASLQKLKNSNAGSRPEWSTYLENSYIWHLAIWQATLQLHILFKDKLMQCDPGCRLAPPI
jgi:hypothetical protein